MNEEDLQMAFRQGRLDDRTFRDLSTWTERARPYGEGPAAQLLRDRLAQVNRSAPESAPADGSKHHPPTTSLSFPDHGRHPGLKYVFEQLHLQNMSTADEHTVAGQANLQVQLLSRVRLQCQVCLAMLTRRLWGQILPWLDQGFLLIPGEGQTLDLPAELQETEWCGHSVVQIPLDQRLPQMLGLSQPAILLAVLRRCWEGMGRLVVDVVLKQADSLSTDIAAADELLQVFRNTNVAELLLNGLVSGVADVLNPLHCMITNLVQTRGDHFAAGRLHQGPTIDHFIHFVTALACFNLDAIAELEAAWRMKPTDETVKWITSRTKQSRWQGACVEPLDCDANPACFVVRFVEEAGEETPILDLDTRAFPTERLVPMRSRLLRLGCPSLGTVLPEFARSLVRCYTSVIFPCVTKESISVRAGSDRDAHTQVGDAQLTSLRPQPASFQPRSLEKPILNDSQPAQASHEGLREVRYEYTPVLCDILRHLNSSLVVTTYQAGKLLILGVHEQELTISFLDFDQPMGFAFGGDRLAVGTRRQIHFLKAAHQTADSITPQGQYDGCFLPRTAFYTGAIHGHDLAFGKAGLWVVNTLFSCLCTLHDAYSFVPEWRPRFITQLADQDRCHLNGLAMDDGEPRFVTLLAPSDEPAGWRGSQRDGGCVIDVPSGEFVARGLSMPHSPRFRNGRLWLLHSGYGSLGTIDLSNGKYDPVEQMPGYTRGLAFAGQFAFVGISKIRETAVFGGVPIAESKDPLRCGIGVVDLLTGKTVAVFQFLSGIEEIFAVDVIHGLRSPFIAGASIDQQQRELWIVPQVPES